MGRIIRNGRGVGYKSKEFHDAVHNSRDAHALVAAITALQESDGHDQAFTNSKSKCMVVSKKKRMPEPV